MKVIDNFLSSDDLEFWQEFCKSNPVTTVDLPEGTTLEDKMRELIKPKNPTVWNKFLYATRPNDPITPHKDPKSVTGLYYPFTSDGVLKITNEEGKCETYWTIENRCIILDTGNNIHEVTAPSKETRFAIGMRWKNEN